MDGGDPLALHREKSVNSGVHKMLSKMSCARSTPKDPGHSDDSSSDQTGDHSVHRRRLAKTLNHVESYEVAASTWDACLLVGQGSINFGDSVLLCLACGIGFTLQAVFCLIVLTRMTQDPLSKVDLEQIRQWRLFTGHSAQHYEPISGTSLVARVCAGTRTLSFAGMQADLYGSLADFTHGDGGAFSSLNGRVLCALCLILWVLVILKEVTAIKHFVTMLLLKTKPGCSKVVVHGNNYKFEAISRRRCAAILALNVLPRAGIVVLLFISGLLFLGHTDNLGDLLLNSLALTFILDIGNILFGALAPASVRHMQANLEAIPISKVSRKQLRHRFADVQVIFTLALVFGMVVLIDQAISRPFFEYMETATEVLCGGQVNFIAAKSKATNVMFTAQTQEVVQTDAGYTPPGSIQYDKVAMLQRTGLPHELGLWGGGVPSAEDAALQPDAFVEVTIEEVSNMWSSTEEASAAEMTCADALAYNTSDSVIAANEAVYYYFDNRQSDCASLASLCHSHNNSDYRMVRALCPETCGCNEPSGGLYDLHGCSTQCKSSWLARAKRAGAERSCTDHNTSELADMNGWATFMTEFEAVLNASGFLQATLEHLRISDLLNESSYSGCGVIASLVSHCPIDPCDTTSSTHASAAFFCPATCGLACPAFR